MLIKAIKTPMLPYPDHLLLHTVVPTQRPKITMCLEFYPRPLTIKEQEELLLTARKLYFAQFWMARWPLFNGNSYPLMSLCEFIKPKLGHFSNSSHNIWRYIHDHIQQRHTNRLQFTRKIYGLNILKTKQFANMNKTHNLAKALLLFMDGHIGEMWYLCPHLNTTSPIRLSGKHLNLLSLYVVDSNQSHLFIFQQCGHFFPSPIWCTWGEEMWTGIQLFVSQCCPIQKPYSQSIFIH